MKLKTKTGEEIAKVKLNLGTDGLLHATALVGGKEIELPGVETSIAKEDGDLAAHIRVPGMVNLTMAVEAADIKALKGLMNKDALSFLMGAIFKG